MKPQFTSGWRRKIAEKEQEMREAREFMEAHQGEVRQLVSSLAQRMTGMPETEVKPETVH